MNSDKYKVCKIYVGNTDFTPSSAALATAPEVDALLIFRMIPRLIVSPLKQQL